MVRGKPRISGQKKGGVVLVPAERTKLNSPGLQKREEASKLLSGLREQYAALKTGAQHVVREELRRLGAAHSSGVGSCAGRRAGSAPVLEARNIAKIFQEGQHTVPVLKGCSLSLTKGEIVTLEGPSGSGKTTFLSIVGCILTPTSGSLSIDGETVEAKRPERLPEIRKKFIGFVFQQFNLFPSLTALENVQYALNIKGIRDAAARKEAERVLDQVGLVDRKKFLPRDLSGGQKQRVALARALAGSSPILLADEPTANLDGEAGAQILTLFRDLAKRENRALLIVTHDAKVRSISDRILRIENGRLEGS